MTASRRICSILHGCGRCYLPKNSVCPFCGCPEWGSEPGCDMRDYIYDLETYPNFFSMAVLHDATGQRWQFESSDRVNHMPSLLMFLNALQNAVYPDGSARMVGFNNLGFDYPLIHFIMDNPGVDYRHIYEHAQAIFRAQDYDDQKFDFMIWGNNRYIEQLDLYKIHHFDNNARRTSLKALQFNMRSESVEDLPFPPGTILTNEQKDVTLSYNWHDVEETRRFFHMSLPAIEFREVMTKKYRRDFMNHNDTKIGKDFFIMKLEEQQPGCCYGKDENNRRVIRQTKRKEIQLIDAVFPWVKFENPEFNRILDYFKSRTITETKGVFSDLSCRVKGFDFVFGVGGIHGSLDSVIVSADDDHLIIDVDVKSYYPNLAIKNRVFPAHLGEFFCDIYESLYNQRDATPKADPVNAMLKLALNGVYGDSNNVYSAFYDPLYTMTITINGQLLLCLLAEQLMKVRGLQLLQINTDGLTFKIPKASESQAMMVCDWWQATTKLTLERADYSRMFIRDVNNYIAEKTNGELKNKGAYEWDRKKLDWHKNHSALVVPAAATAALIDGENIEHYIRTHPNDLDFMLRAKIPRNSRLMLETPTHHFTMQNLTRYYVARSGGALIKIMPPLKGKEVERRIGIEVGWKVAPCNKVSEFRRDNVEYQYYIREVEKLVNCLKPI